MLRETDREEEQQQRRCQRDRVIDREERWRCPLCVCVCSRCTCVSDHRASATLRPVSACLARDRNELRVDVNNMVGTIPSDILALPLKYVQLHPCKCNVTVAVAALPLSAASV
jgi:hypothetical protein